MEKNLHILAEELRRRIPVQRIESMNVKIWAETDDVDGSIYIAPAKGGFCADTVRCVKDVALFAAYHEMYLNTKSFETGAGLELHF